MDDALGFGKVFSTFPGFGVQGSRLRAESSGCGGVVRWFRVQLEQEPQASFGLQVLTANNCRIEALHYTALKPQKLHLAP